MPDVSHLAGIGHLLANHQTYLGDVEYALTIIEALYGSISVTGRFAFTTEPHDLTAYAALTLELSDGFCITIVMTYHDPIHNSYGFEMEGPYTALV